MKLFVLLCLLILPLQQQQTKPPKQCFVTEVVTEGVRSDCGTWRPAKTEKIFMPAEVSRRLKVGDVFYFVWTETRWVAALPAPEKPEKLALIFGPEPQRIEFMETAGAERLYAALEAKRVAGTNTAEDDRLHAALTQALGTIPEPEAAPHVNSTRERLDWEIRRGVHKPTQQPVCRYRGDQDCWRLN